MYRCATTSAKVRCFAWIVTVLLSSVAAGASPEPVPTTEIDGNDLIVTLPVTVNNSWHLAVQDAEIVNDNVRLHYFIMQNRDRMVRSQKQLVLHWRLKGCAGRKLSFQTAGDHVFLTTGQLNGLTEALPQAFGL